MSETDIQSYTMRTGGVIHKKQILFLELNELIKPYFVASIFINRYTIAIGIPSCSFALHSIGRTRQF